VEVISALAYTSLAEVVKTLLGRGEEPRVYFWRTSTGAEVDLVVDTKGQLVPIEVKLSATPHAGMASVIRIFQELHGGRAAPGYVIHPGDIQLRLAPHVSALFFGAFG
jgi:predicted AAA+ superfamily ATPase